MFGVRTIRLLTLLFAILLPAEALATVCRLPGLNGYEAASERAKKIMPSVTGSMDEAAIYVERNTDGGFYFHSNFITRGHDQPTKIGGEKDLDDLETAAMNIIYDERPSERETVRFRSSFRKKMTIFLDKSAFDDAGRPLLDLGEAENLIVVDPVTKTSEPLERLVTRDSPPPRLLAKASGCCFLMPASFKRSALKAKLASMPVNRGDIKVVSLIVDSATESQLASSSLKGSVAIKSGLELAARSDLAPLFTKLRGQTVVLLGHTEGSSFVVRDAAMKERFRVPVAEVRKLAMENDVQLLDLGCNTGHEISMSDKIASVDVVSERFNTVKAVQMLDTAFAKSKNYDEFFSNLTSPDLKLVVGEAFFDRNPRTFSSRIFAQVKRALWADVEVARVTLTANAAGRARTDAAGSVLANGSREAATASDPNDPLRKLEELLKKRQR